MAIATCDEEGVLRLYEYAPQGARVCCVVSTRVLREA